MGTLWAHAHSACPVQYGHHILPPSSCPADLSGVPAGLLNLVHGCGTTNNNGNLLSQQIGASDARPPTAGEMSSFST